ncbi:MAG: toxin-antitoxin system YwqK family antitoxin [Phycisphaerae bacterium]
MCAIGLATVGVLAFGDPQWGYLVYRFQADVYPGREPPVPRGFTGVWRTWWRCGALKEKMDVVNGIRHGAYTLYHEEGPPAATGLYADGKQDGLWVFRDSTGRKEQQCPFRSGLPHGQVLKWDESGKRHAEWSWDGQPVTEEEFNRRATGVETGGAEKDPL